MRAVVTGGCGFIGSGVVKHLMEDGWDVIVIDNFYDGRIRNLPSVKQGTLQILPIDVCDMAELYGPGFNNIDWIFHIAGHYANIRSLLEPMLNIKTNMMGTMAALMFARNHNVKNFMYASSSGVYGAMDVVAYAENSQPKPSTPYECTKYAGETLCCGWGEIYKMSIVSPRFFNVYGPGDVPGEYRAVIPNFFRKALRGEEIHITGERASRDFTYIDDVVNAILAGVNRAMEMPGLELVYNIATGRETFIVKLAEQIISMCESQSELIISEKRDWDNALRRVGDVHKFRALFPQEAASMRLVEDGLRACSVWYKEVCR